MPRKLFQINQFCIAVSLCLFCIPTTLCANILAIFPTASYSHQQPMLALARALTEKGHNLTVITPNPFRTPISNYTEIDISFTYNYWNKKDSSGGEEELIDLKGKRRGLKLLTDFIRGINLLTNITLASEPMQSFIEYLDEQKPKFDLVLYEDLLHPAFLGFVHKLGYPPLISMTTLPIACSIDMSAGNVCNPSYTPDKIFSTTNFMNFWQRFMNYFYVYYSKWFILPGVFSFHDTLARKYFGPSCPSTQTIVQNRTLLISSSLPLFEYPRPLFPNTVYVGPLHIQESNKPLSEDLQNWIRGAKKGVIYFSFGSNVRSASLDKAKRSKILAAFAKLTDYRIIWKWEDEMLEELPSNVLCRKWLPQKDILAHPDIKLFITQGGLQSLQEGIYYQVPMIGIAFFGDQNYNVRIISRLGVGTFMEFEDISTQNLYKQMTEILNNDSYPMKLKEVSDLSKTQMLSPLEAGVWWVEYVLKSGGNVSHLKPQWYHLAWFQYMGLDVLLAVLSLPLMGLYGIYKLVLILSEQKVREKLKSQ